MRTIRDPAPDDIDLAALWRLAVRSLPKLVLWAFVAGAATYGVLSLIAPRYASEAQISIESVSTNNPYTDPNRAGGASDSVSVRMDKEAVNTHVRALQSVDLAERIVRDMNLGEKVEFNSALGAPDMLTALLRIAGIGKPRPGESENERVLNAYFTHLEVYQVKDSRVIGIRFTSIDPALAAAVANRIAETYREMLAHQSVAETDDVQKALEPQIEKLASEAAASEAEVEKFRGEANIFKGGQQATGLNEQQLAELNAELSRAKAARSDAEVRARQARDMLGVGAEALPDVQKSPVIQALVQSRVRVERQISELSATLLPGHPRMRQLNADLAGLKTQIKAEVAKIIDGLAKEAKVAAMREEAVAKSVAEIKARIVDTGPDEAKLRSLEANARSKRAELDRLRAQYEANRVRADDSRTIPVEVQIVSMARPSSVPVFPKKTATVLLVSAGFLMFGMALIITRGLLTGVSRPRPVERDPANRPRPIAPVLPDPRRFPDPRSSVAPKAPPEPAPGRAAAPAHDARVKPVASVTAIAERLKAMRASGLTGIRSLVAGEAAVQTLAAEASELGKTLAALGQTVIVVDWAPMGGGIAEALKHPNAPGMLELVKGKVKFEDVIGTLGTSGAHIIPAGASLAAAEIIDPDRVNYVLDALDDVYDQIIVVSAEDSARHLFEGIEGRFDCGIVVTEPEAASSAADERLETFLGYEVDGMELMRYVPPAARLGARASRIARVVRSEPRASLG